MRLPVLTSLYEVAARMGKRKNATKPKKMSVIVSTYNNPVWLEKLLWGYINQRFDRVPFDIVIADDGSREDTADLIKAYRREFDAEIKHVWHPDEGFRKCTILNRAILLSDSDYLVFTDQDCVPRDDFLEMHYRYAEKGYYLSGGYTKLPLDVSLDMSREDIVSQRVFDVVWMKRKYKFSATKFLPRMPRTPLIASCCNWLTTTMATCNGNCFSAWKDDLLAVNGYNEALGYGGLDRELGERLNNYGIRGKQLRYSLVCLHLSHDRPYESNETWKANAEIRRRVRSDGTCVALSGIRSLVEPAPENADTIPVDFGGEQAKKVG